MLKIEILRFIEISIEQKQSFFIGTNKGENAK